MSFLRRLKQRADLYNDFFRVAVWTWLLKNDEAAHVAAFSMAVAASTDQRRSMVACLYDPATEANVAYLLQLDAASQAKLTRRLFQLLSEISAKDWGFWDCVKVQRALKKADLEYYHAIERADSTVFLRRHPDLPNWVGVAVQPTR